MGWKKINKQKVEFLPCKSGGVFVERLARLPILSASCCSPTGLFACATLVCVGKYASEACVRSVWVYFCPDRDVSCVASPSSVGGDQRHSCQCSVMVI